MSEGPATVIGQYIHASKYRGEGESFRELCNRVANALKDNDEHFHTFRDILLSMSFLPAGRVQSAIGSTKAITPFNCYVSGVIADSFVEGPGSIMARATEAAATMRMGGGIGYDFSTLRPKGELIKSLMSQASGPVSFMEIYDAVCRTVLSAGHRRGAQMGVLRIDHPDVEEFVRAKQNTARLTGFNISLAVTDEFMRAVESGGTFDLRWNGKHYRTLDARTLWEQIMRGTWDWAEPGVLFIDRINEMNNLYYCEEIAATNPCSEQPLPPYGACLLGSFNLTKYIRQGKNGFSFNYTQLQKDIPPVIRAMDNIVDIAKYPLKEQENEAKNKRRMGIGITGLANAGEVLGYVYGTAAFIHFERRVLRTITTGCYLASADLAREKGAFPFYNDRYLRGRFIQTLPDVVKENIRKFGIRNSHLTSIAPTGTISLCADNVSSGIEPVYSYSYKRIVQTFEGPKELKVEDYGVKFFKTRGKKAADCTIEDHLAVLAESYKHVDSAVSKTCNVSPKMPWEDFKEIYFEAWRRGCKGCTTFNPGGKRMGILEAPVEEDGGACYIDPVNGLKTCD